MKKGDKVMVYEDPITMQKPEGEVELLRLLQTATAEATPGKVLQRWSVRFCSDGFEAQRALLVDKED